LAEDPEDKVTLLVEKNQCVSYVIFLLLTVSAMLFYKNCQKHEQRINAKSFFTTDFTFSLVFLRTKAATASSAS